MAVNVLKFSSSLDEREYIGHVCIGKLTVSLSLIFVGSFCSFLRNVTYCKWT